MNIKNNTSFWLAAFLTFFVDQYTKLMALKFLPYDTEIILTPLISLHRVYNDSTVLLNYSFPQHLNLFRMIWVVVALLLAFSIYWVLKQPIMKENNKETYFAKGGLLILLGSIWGNAFDRIFRSDGVIDFIRINYWHDTIPILNMADITIYFAELCFIITWFILLKSVCRKYNLKKLEQK